MRSDAGGMEYAQEAYRITESCDVSPFDECLTYMVLAQMYYLDGDYDKSLYFVEHSDSLARQGGYVLLTPQIELLYGDICSEYEDYEQAEEHYSVALATSANTA